MALNYGGTSTTTKTQQQAPTAPAPNYFSAPTPTPTTTSPLRSTSTTTASQPVAKLMSTATPVSPNGKLAPAAGAAPAATSPQTPAQQQYPTQVGTATGTGGNVETGTGASHLQYPYSPYPTVNPAGAESQQYANLMQLLQNPMSMTPDLINQMKGANRDEAAMLQKQLTDQIHNSTAGRGLQVGGGWDAAQSRNAGMQAIQQILQGNRSIDMQAAQTNHQDLLNALQAGSGALGSAEDRNLSAAQLALQRALGIGGLNMDRSRLSEQGREFNAGNTLNWAQLMNNMVMGRAGYGLDMAQMQNGMQNSMMGGLFG